MSYSNFMDTSLGGKSRCLVLSYRYFRDELKKVKMKEGERVSREIYEFAKKIGMFDFAEYIAKKGRIGIELSKNAIMWMDNPENREFRNLLSLKRSFSNHVSTIEKVWYGGEGSIESEEEYLGVIKRILTHPNIKRVMWRKPGFLYIKPRLAYVYEHRLEKPIVIVIDDEGFIEDVVTDNSLKEVYKSVRDFYEIDPLESEY